VARKKDQGKRRGEIVDAMLTLIADRGARKVRYADVAELVGMTPGAVGYYFPTIDGLVLYAHNIAIERHHEGILRAASSYRDPRDRLIALIDHGVPTAPDPILRVLADAVLTATISVPHAILHTSSLHRYSATIETVLEVGADRGVFRPAVDIRQIARTTAHLINEVSFEPQLTFSQTGADEARAIVIDYAAVATMSDLRARMPLP
jgi:AcrR family transcriptional regulator